MLYYDVVSCYSNLFQWHQIAVFSDCGLSLPQDYKLFHVQLRFVCPAGRSQITNNCIFFMLKLGGMKISPQIDMKMPAILLLAFSYLLAEKNSCSAR